MQKEVFEKLMSCNDIESVKDVFKGEKIEVSNDDIKELGKVIMFAVKKKTL